MTKAVTWQGSCDMLCGVYATAQILAHYAKGGRSTTVQRAFGHLLKSVEDAGLLTAQKISHPTKGGFHDFEIASVFNEMSPRKRCGLTAFVFTDKRLTSLKGSQKRQLMKDGAYAVIQERGEEHWIAVLGVRKGGGYLCFDPQLVRNSSSRQQIRWERGVLFSTPDIFGIN